MVGKGLILCPPATYMVGKGLMSSTSNAVPGLLGDPSIPVQCFVSQRLQEVVSGFGFDTQVPDHLQK